MAKKLSKRAARRADSRDKVREDNPVRKTYVRPQTNNRLSGKIHEENKWEKFPEEPAVPVAERFASLRSRAQDSAVSTAQKLIQDIEKDKTETSDVVTS